MSKWLMEGKVGFVKGVKPLILDSLDTDTIYFFTDTEEIYLNGQYYSKAASTLGFANNGASLKMPADTPAASIGAGSVLVTEGANITIGRKSLSVTTGGNFSVVSAPAGTTTYAVTNNYKNRIICMLCKDGVACLNENDAANTKNITSVKVGEAALVPSSTDSTSPILITVEETLNPDTTAKEIRVYPAQKGFSTIWGGVAGSNNQSGYSIVAGQYVYNSSNGSAVLGNSLYNTGNACLIAGREQINIKKNVFLAGCGHDTSNGSDSVSAVGTFSNITSGTLFAIGDGTSHTARSNAFEVRSEGIILKSANGTSYLISVSDTGTISATAI